MPARALCRIICGTHSLEGCRGGQFPSNNVNPSEFPSTVVVCHPDLTMCLSLYWVSLPALVDSAPPPPPPVPTALPLKTLLTGQARVPPVTAGALDRGKTGAGHTPSPFFSAAPPCPKGKASLSIVGFLDLRPSPRPSTSGSFSWRVIVNRCRRALLPRPPMWMMSSAFWISGLRKGAGRSC